MKFWAKVSFNCEKNAEYLIRSFFKEFNPESSIVIRGKEAKVEIIFDEPPMQIIQAITECDLLEFNYGKPLGEYDEAVCKQSAKPESNNANKVKKSRQSAKEIPELIQLANKSSSYEEFVDFVADWLEMGKRKEFFKNLLLAANQTKKIIWSNLEAILTTNNISYSLWDKVWCTRQVTSKFTNAEAHITIMGLIKEIVKYKDYNFNQEINKKLVPNEKSEIVEETISSNEEIEVPEEGHSVLEIIEKPKIKVKMECMPEIPYFEEVLGAVDKTKPIEERVKYVLMAMKLDKLNSKDQDGILKIAVTAVKSKEISYDAIFKTVRIPFESITLARMTFSAFINDFVATYDPTKKVKLLDFLKDLQTIVI